MTHRSCRFIEINNACKCSNPKSYQYGQTCNSLCEYASFNIVPIKSTIYVSDADKIKKLEKEIENIKRCLLVNGIVCGENDNDL